MKKITLASVLMASSIAAFAEVGVGIELGYETSTVASNYGDCFSECYGEKDPSGISLGVTWEIPAVSGLYIGVDLVDSEDDEASYDNGSSFPNDKVNNEHKRTAFEVGYKYELNENAKLTAAIVRADYEWQYRWDDRDGSPRYYQFDAEDNGVSFVLGAEKNVAGDLLLSGALSAGFETGIKVGMKTMLTEQFGLKVDYSALSYELEDFGVDNTGSPDDPSSSNGDGNIQFDTTTMRVSATYNF